MVRAQSLPKVIIGYPANSIASIQLFIAQEKGFFREEGIDAQLNQVRADAAIDIGETLIGMHLKPVAVPVRPRSKTVGEARVTLAATRPKLIGGARAVYELKQEAGPSARECR